MKKNYGRFKPGLQATPEDSRDFQLGAITALPKLSELPEEFRFETLGVKDQGATDYCSAFASDLISEIQEGIEFCPEWGFAASKDLSGGDLHVFGQNIRTALKRHIEFGALPLAHAPFTLKNKDDSFLRDIGNWPAETFRRAVDFQKKSYFKISGPYDAYNNIRASIWQFREKKQAAVMGLMWHWPTDTKFLQGTSKDGFGHMVAIIGWTASGLVIQNSAGLESGDKGLHILPREEANYYVKIFGSYMLVDLDKEEVRRMIDHGIKIGDNWLVDLLKTFISVFLPFLRIWK